MANSIQNMREIQNRKNEISAQRAALREESRTLRLEMDNVKQDFIREAMNEFLARMENSWHRKNYLTGVYSCDFTKHVSRTWKRYGWTSSNPPSESYREACINFTAALEKVKRVFLEELRNNEDFRNHIVETSGLKNLSSKI